MSVLNSIEENLNNVKELINSIENTADRVNNSVSLVAVSKQHSLEAIMKVFNAGHKVFGENRVQEGLRKFTGIKETHTDLELHLIGPLQTNKVRDAVNLFDVIETLDRPKLAKEISREIDRTGKKMGLLIQVNTGEEAQKSGVSPGNFDGFFKYCSEDLNLPVKGLMCIPPVNDEPAKHFALLAEMSRRYKLPYLSMGMSADFETAIRMGATHVRIGTAIFGEREKVD